MNSVRRLWIVIVVASAACATALPGWTQEDEPKRINAHFANETVPLDSRATTVAGFLGELSIDLPAGAQIDPPPSAALMDGMSVFLHGLSVTRGVYTESIPVQLELVESWRYGPETMELTSPGQGGLRRIHCTIFYLGDREVGRRQWDETIRPMRPAQVVCFRALNEQDGPSAEQILSLRMKPGDHHVPPARYKKTLTVTATAYEPGPRSCGRFASGRTAAGYKAGYGVVAVDPAVIPMHSRLFIEGYGYAIAGDRGSAIKGKRVDVGFLTVDECYEWGRRTVKVYVLY